MTVYMKKEKKELLTYGMSIVIANIGPVSLGGITLVSKVETTINLLTNLILNM